MNPIPGPVDRNKDDLTQALPKHPLADGMQHDLAKKALAKFGGLTKSQQKDWAGACQPVNDLLIQLGKNSIADRDDTAMKSLVYLAAHGGTLGEKACELLHHNCKSAFGSEQLGPMALDRIKDVGRHAFEAVEALQGDQATLNEMPVYLLKLAEQYALGGKKTVLAGAIGGVLNPGLPPNQANAPEDQEAALKAVHAELDKTGVVSGNMKPGLGVINLGPNGMNQAERTAQLFAKLEKGEQSPVSFRVDNNYLHGFVCLGKDGKQHIYVLNSHAGEPGFMNTFMDRLGLNMDACKSVDIGSTYNGSLSDASLAEWLFTFCAKADGDIPKRIKKFAEHAKSAGCGVDFLQAERVRQRLSASGTQRSDAGGVTNSATSQMGSNPKPAGPQNAQHIASKPSSGVKQISPLTPSEQEKIRKEVEEDAKKFENFEQMRGLELDKELEDLGKEESNNTIVYEGPLTRP